MGFVNAVAKEDLKNFLKTELKNYFEDKPTLLTANELRETTDFYFSLSEDEEINLSKSSLSQNNIAILENALNIVSEESNNEKVEEKTIKKRLKCCTKLDTGHSSKLLAFILRMIKHPKKATCEQSGWTECSENPSCEEFEHNCVGFGGSIGCEEYSWSDKGYQIGGYPKEEIC